MPEIKRSKIATFLNTGTADEPEWSLIGLGVAEQTIAYNPTTNDYAWIHENTPTTQLDSYKPTIPNPMSAYSGDEVFEFVDKLRIDRAVGDDAKTDMLIVYLYKTETTGAYPAERNNCTVQIDDFGGAGAATATINFTLSLNGDPVKGTFNPTTKEFTPDSEGE